MQFVGHMDNLHMARYCLYFTFEYLVLKCHYLFFETKSRLFVVISQINPFCALYIALIFDVDPKKIVS